jgi:hypothetical protein
MPADEKAVVSQMLLAPGTTWLCPGAFATCPYFRVTSRQRLAPIESSFLMRKKTESDSVVSSAKENLFTS